MSSMSKPVTIYTTKTCVYCRASKDFMQKNGIVYKEIDVGSDAAKAREMIEKSGQMGVPVIVVGEGADEQLVVGYDQSRLTQLLL